VGYGFLFSPSKVVVWGAVFEAVFFLGVIEMTFAPCVFCVASFPPLPFVVSLVREKVFLAMRGFMLPVFRLLNVSVERRDTPPPPPPKYVLEITMLRALSTSWLCDDVRGRSYFLSLARRQFTHLLLKELARLFSKWRDDRCSIRPSQYAAFLLGLWSCPAVLLFADELPPSSGGCLRRP